MISKSEWFRKSLSLTRDLVRAQILPLAALFLVSALLNIWAEDAMQLTSPTEDTQRWMTQLGVGVWDLCEGVILCLVLSFGIPKVHKFSSAKFLEAPFSTPYLSSFLAEYLRMLAQCLMYGLLLLLPGFVRYAQLIFVPLIALFDRSYREGEQDALRLSDRLTRGRMLFMAALLAFTIALEVVVEFIPQFSPDLHTLVVRVLSAAIGFLISIWAYSLIFLLFESFMLSLPDEEL